VTVISKGQPGRNKEQACRDVDQSGLPSGTGADHRPGDDRTRSQTTLNPMQLLPTQFSRSGYRYDQVGRTATTAIYSQAKHGRIQAFAVIKIRRNPAVTMPGGMAYPAREAFPLPESWGADGFTCPTLAFAPARQMALEKGMYSQGRTIRRCPHRRHHPRPSRARRERGHDITTTC
jgi:hypothetical protein